MESSQRELRRLPEGRTCPVSRCKAKRYYEEDGYWYCSNNHQLEGIVEDAVDEDNVTLGATVVKKVVGENTKRLSHKRLKGSAARLLFLECFQIVLRSQVRWLMDEKNCPESLDKVAKVLWELRLRGCPTDGVGETQTAGSTSRADSRSETENIGGIAPGDRGPDLGGKWRTPSIIDTLSLCYLACLKLGIPTRIADIAYWVNQEDMPFRNIVSPSEPTSLPRFLPSSSLPSLYGHIVFG